MPTKTPRIVSVPIVLDPAAQEAAEQAKHTLDQEAARLLADFPKRVDLEQAVTGEDRQTVARRLYEQDKARLAQLEDEFAQAQEKLREATRFYSFRPLGWKAWRELKAKHPSKEPKYAFDVDAIAPTLLRLASHEPRLSAEQVEEILTSPDWSEGEVALLVNAAVGAQS